MKSSRKKSNEKVLQHIADHYTISLGEAEDYIYILKKEGVEMILERAGVDEKEIKKLLKEVQWQKIVKFTELNIMLKLVQY